MKQFLQRGCQVSDNCRIKRMIASGHDWQIYLTNIDSYVLAVKTSLFEKWARDYSLPTGIFLADDFEDCRVLQSSSNYIISSMEMGPYPENNGQVEAFSIAFKTATVIYSESDIHDAVYIEEYSLILPVSFNKPLVDNSIVYGKWIAGGINVSIDSFERVCKVMSWLPPESLARSVRLAGFDVTVQPNDSENDASGLVSELIESDVPKPKNCLPERAFSLIGRPELEQFFNDNIIDVVLHQEQYKRMGIDFPGATILHGPPGCGKTYAVEKLTEYLGWKRFDIDSSTIASSYIHDTSKKISDVFLAAIKVAPSILVIDEMEAFLSDRGRSGPTGTHHVEEVAEFLRRIPEAISKGVLVFAMTNMIDAIDPAILRRGRFDYIVEVKMASVPEIEALLLSKFKELPIDDGVDANKISVELEGHPISDVTFVLREAGRFAVKRELKKISEDCFSDAIRQLPKKNQRNKIGFSAIEEVYK